MDSIKEVEIDMKMIASNAITSSPAKDSDSDSDSYQEEITPVKRNKNDLSLKIDANESMELRKNLAPNGLLTFSTPNQNYGRLQYCQELSAFNLYRSLLNYNSTPKNVSQTIRKPRVNFHSIDDIVNGGKINSEEDSEHHDSGYQSTSSANVTNGTPIVEKKEIKNKQIEEYENSDNDGENDENNDKGKNNKKIRTTFSDQQKFMLEQYFRRNPYPDPRETEDLSKQLILPENVIKVWFQNKRSRDKQRKFSNNTNKGLGSEFTNQLNSLQFLTNAFAPYASAVAASNQIIGGFY